MDFGRRRRTRLVFETTICRWHHVSMRRGRGPYHCRAGLCMTSISPVHCESAISSNSMAPQFNGCQCVYTVPLPIGLVCTHVNGPPAGAARAMLAPGRRKSDSRADWPAQCRHGSTVNSRLTEMIIRRIGWPGPRDSLHTCKYSSYVDCSASLVHMIGCPRCTVIRRGFNRRLGPTIQTPRDDYQVSKRHTTVKDVVVHQTAPAAHAPSRDCIVTRVY